jgi:predicted signal transduction protein with EAL and GGDEF domain
MSDCPPSWCGMGGSTASLSGKSEAVPLTAGGLKPTDAEKALAYTLGHFAAGGGGTIRSLANGCHKLVDDTVERISHILSSISEDGLKIVFQPVVDLSHHRLDHYEVLSLFEEERSPAEFVQFAEGVGMIEELDLTVCQRALGFHGFLDERSRADARGEPVRALSRERRVCRRAGGAASSCF